MPNTARFVDVILPLPLGSAFIYKITDEQYKRLKPGFRVTVQFGKRKCYTALVINIHNEEPEDFEVKNIISILDEKPIVTRLQLDFWNWISTYYMCTVGEVYKAALPSGLKLESETRVFAKPEAESCRLNETEQLIQNILEKNNNLTISKLNSFIGKKDIMPILKSMIDKGIIVLEERLKDKYKPKKKSFIRFSFDYQNQEIINSVFSDLERVPKQLHVFMAYLNMSKALQKESLVDVGKSELLKNSNCSASVLTTLIKKKIFEVYEKEISRLGTGLGKYQGKASLNSFQEKAYEAIKSKFLNKDVVMLHGVTSSGKTEIYIHLINEQINKKKQVLYLLPEIALTTQIINRLKSVFGNKVGVYHSKFSDSERVEIWNSVLGLPGDKKEKYQVILGVRSSVFLPFTNLGLVIIDEEHENTYKQFDPAPRYNARDAGIYLAILHKAKVLLGTATPSMESYYNVITGKYEIVELSERYLNLEMPEIKIVDVKDARRKKQMQSLFTPLMLNSISKALEQNEQIILFQNRRGFSPYLECDICNWIPFCKHCDVSLTYHKHFNQLICHYCGYTITNPKTCHSCGGASLLTRGFGTEKIEDEIALIFPGAKIARMDLDSTRSRKSYERIITDFETGAIDILIGTQMISKGLDFNNVKVVGIINADNMLNYPDFRSHERSFQLMAQVSGRAGRKKGRGLVIIQTSDPENQVIRNVVKHDYKTFFNNQLAERKKFKYPPFFRLIEITLKHKKTGVLDKASDAFAVLLKNQFATRVIGPEFPLINKIQGMNLKSILIKFEKDKSITQNKNKIKHLLEELFSTHDFHSLQVNIDVDPM